MAKPTKGGKKTTKYSPNRPNLWGFLQNVLIAALNKGQLPAMFVGLILLIFAWKIPEEQVISFIKEIIAMSNNTGTLAWTLLTISVLASFFLTRMQRRMHTNEIKRMSQEKKALQEQLTKGQLPSSNKKMKFR